jgi:hypothetical protein
MFIPDPVFSPSSLISDPGPKNNKIFALPFFVKDLSQYKKNETELIRVDFGRLDPDIRMGNADSDPGGQKLDKVQKFHVLW